MKSNKKSILINCIAVFFVISLMNCSGSDAAPPKGVASKAQEYTKNENQWEYLVVSFGKTAFSSIEESIKNGNSKLVAFQEFADLLSGHEGIDLQLKLDLLGRFGWELVDTLGSIGGDQQLIMKRARLENRMEAEQKAIKKLGVILREESKKKEERLKKFIEELEKLRSEQNTKQYDGLIELDSKEQRDREYAAQNKAITEIQKMFSIPQGELPEKTKITEVKVSVSVSEEKKNNFSYSGTITIYVDATQSLLFEKNKYRKTQAEDLEAKFLQQAYRSLPISKKSLSDFTLNTEFQIKYAGDFTTVSKDRESININGYPGYWSTH